MNKKLLYTLLGLAGAGLLFVAFRYGKKTKLSRSGKVLFIGDSYTAGTSSYADQLKKEIPSLQIEKIAKVGETTDWMLKQSEGELGKKYNAVFILAGINDVYAKGKIEKAKENLQQMYDLAKKSGAKVIAVTIAPTDYYEHYTPAKGKLTDELNEWIKSNRTPDAVIDFNKMLRKDGKQNTALFVSDKLHASAEAHKMLAKEIQDNILKKNG